MNFYYLLGLVEVDLVLRPSHVIIKSPEAEEVYRIVKAIKK